ncbi:MAG: hypothetical protein INH41_19390, partial [Myxococcaceae bacterium]|nr:hypothetical protein [Myxococcaceae bacterium]
MSVDRDSRDLLEALQVENRELRRRVEAHQQVTARVAALEAEVVGLKRQLELADEARDKWGARLAVIQRRDLEAHVAVLEAHVASLRR